MKVPFLDFSEQYKIIKDKMHSGLQKVFETGCFIQGPPVKEFEAGFAQYCGVNHGVGVNSGTDAIFLALKALDLQPQDEVIVPAFTFIATILGVSHAGAKPILVDIDPQTYNMDPEKLKAAITDKTKAILVVHLYGQPADMDEINQIAQAHGLPVIEDSAQAHGSSYKGKRVGSLGEMSCFSFYPTKGLGGFGDGGIVVTNNEELAKRVRMLGDYGRVGRYDHILKGHNSRLDTVQAVILSEKLKYLDEWNQMRQEKGAYYCDLLKEVEEVQTPSIKEDRTHVFQTFAVRVKNRDQVSDQMKEKGVGVLIHYPIPLHLQVAYQDLGHKRGDFPVSEQVGDSILSLPMFPHISKEQIEYVCDSLKSCYAKSTQC